MSMEPMVRDFTAPKGTEPVVDLAVHSAVDLLVLLWLLEGCNPKRQDFEEYGLGADWFANLADRLHDETKAAIRTVGCGGVWVALLGAVAELPDGSTVDDFIGHLQAMDPIELRARLVQMKGEDGDADLLRAAAEGDADARDRLLDLPRFEDDEDLRDTIRELLEIAPEETTGRIVTALRLVQKDAFAEHEAEFRSVLERDNAARQSLAQRVSVERLVELTTNGISIERGGYRKPILLVPSIVGRPWVIFTETPEQLLMAYPVADEYMDADPDAPPNWLIRTYKALGDEKRLRILRILARGPAALHQLADELDTPKSTLHHHLMLLRTAGLVKVQIGVEGKDKEYELREDLVPETAAVLHGYIKNGGGR
ncbi:MAG TPA: metalloregulator ArsR/SmtB family transcription factor [Acidimicrobiia bacterium]|nr:metalloregulator ArsR/SmtB family transcription factor [Acidimicrobiia bacterium]